MIIKKIKEIILLVILSILFGNNNNNNIYNKNGIVFAQFPTGFQGGGGGVTSGLMGSSLSMGGARIKKSSSITSPAIDSSLLSPIGGNIFPINNRINDKTTGGLLNQSPIQDLTTGSLISSPFLASTSSSGKSDLAVSSSPSPSSATSTSISTTTTTTSPSPSSTPSLLSQIVTESVSPSPEPINQVLIEKSDSSSIAPPQNTLLSRIPKTTILKKKTIPPQPTNNLNINLISEEDGEDDDSEYNTLPTQIMVCVGSICPNGACMDDSPNCIGQLNDITTRCPYDTPVRCPDGSCSQSLGLCQTSTLNCTLGVCPNGQCAPCNQYDGCPIDIPFQCPTGVCSKYASQCQKCLNGHMKCFDGSCQSPCPYPPFYYKPITLSRNIIDGKKETKVTVNSYEQPLDYNSNHIKILDIYIESETLPSNTLLKVQSVPDSSVELVKGEQSWPNNYNYQLALLSPIINITASYNGTSLKHFSKKIRFEFNLINNPTFDINKICFGFINETSGRWEKVSNVTIENSMMVGYTDHFTSFAMLTSYNGDPIIGSNYKGLNSQNDNDSPFAMKEKNIPRLMGIVFGCIGACLLIIIIGVCWHHSSKHGGLRHWLISRGSKPSTPSHGSPKINESGEIILNNSTSSIISTTSICSSSSTNNLVNSISSNSLNINNSTSININNNDYNINNNNNNNIENNNDCSNKVINNNHSSDELIKK
ncbi:hypothetical protein RB653_003173 [Dictyostelium firmibasis]|uniref:Uncharacterized protein n=1 Tax=Dictyostelium firmibasis TaxID=79012 RepID=A0AAN7U414_9MYCE